MNINKPRLLNTLIGIILALIIALPIGSKLIEQDGGSFLIIEDTLFQDSLLTVFVISLSLMWLVKEIPIYNTLYRFILSGLILISSFSICAQAIFNRLLVLHEKELTSFTPLFCVLLFPLICVYLFFQTSSQRVDSKESHQ